MKRKIVRVMKSLLAVSTMLIIGGCATTPIKMNIITEELFPQPKTKTVEVKYEGFDDNQKKFTKTCWAQEIKFPPDGDYPEHQIDWVKIHPTENIAILEFLAETKNRRKNREIFCVQLDDFRNLWHLKLHEKGKISVQDVVFLDNRGVVLLNDQNHIIALDLVEGSELWRIEQPKIDKIKYFKDTNRLLVLFSNKSLSMLDSQTGETIWSSKLEKDYPGEPLLKGEDIFILSKGIKKYNLNKGLVWETDFDTYYKVNHPGRDVAASVLLTAILLPTTGHAYVQTSVPDFYYGCYSPPVIIESILYVASLGQLKAINLDNGETIWGTDKIENIENIQEFHVGGDRIYARYGGYSLKETGNKYSYVPEGANGIIVFDLKTGGKIWQNDMYDKEKDASPLIEDYYIAKERIVLTTSAGIKTLDKMTGETLQEFPAPNFQVGDLVSVARIAEGILVKGKEGISLANRESFEPIWNQTIAPAKSEFKFISSQEVNVTFWKEQFLLDHYYRAFFEKFFRFNPGERLCVLAKEEGSIVGVDVATGLIRYELPIDTNNFYLYQNKLFLIQGNRLRILQIKNLK